MSYQLQINVVKLFLRLSLAAAFLSAVADRFGFWPQGAWGNWQNFVNYTAELNPWIPSALIPVLAYTATIAEIVFGLFLLIGFKTKWTARASGALLLLFGLSMTLVYGIKAPLDYSVFSGAAAAFSLSLIKTKYFEIDLLRTTSV